jgi:hypothetical protein
LEALAFYPGHLISYCATKRWRRAPIYGCLITLSLHFVILIYVHLFNEELKPIIVYNSEVELIMVVVSMLAFAPSFAFAMLVYGPLYTVGVGIVIIDEYIQAEEYEESMFYRVVASALAFRLMIMVFTGAGVHFVLKSEVLHFFDKVHERVMA